MPTTRPRFAITATDEVEEALAAAALRWPEDKDSPRMLLLHLIAEGTAAVRADAAIDARRKAVLATAGAFDDVYPPGYLDELRAEWPE